MVAAGIRGDVEHRLARLEEVLHAEELRRETRVYIEEAIALWREHLENERLDGHWWRTQVGDLAIAPVWPDLDRLVGEGYTRDEAMEWLMHGGIDDPASSAVQWRGYTPDEYVAWQRSVSSRGEADRWVARGWTAEQVLEVWDGIGHRLAGGMGTRDGDWDAQHSEMEAWSATGIPARRVVLYTRIGMSVEEAQRHEEEDRNTGEDLDARLATLAALHGHQPPR